jgi:hypothetical protein
MPYQTYFIESNHENYSSNKIASDGAKSLGACLSHLKDLKKLSLNLEYYSLKE